MNEEEKELVLQSLKIAISLMKRKSKRQERRLVKAESPLEQSLFCKSIDMINDKIIKFEKLKNKISNL